MKEAAGEANMTVITIVLIAIVLAVGTVIVNGMMESTKRSSCCQAQGGTIQGTSCVIGNVTQLATNNRSAYGACIEGK